MYPSGPAATLRDTEVAVSEENVELVRSIYRAWGSERSARHLIDPQLEYVNPPYAVEAGTRRDSRALGAIREVYPDFRVEPQQFLDAGEDVVVIGIARGTSASGLEAQWRQGYIWTVRDGRAIRFRWFNDPDEALRAAGLAG
jgi:ketosteroid isomerase-like protein